MGSKKFPWRNSLPPIGSIFQKLLHGRRNVTRLRQDHILKLGLVSAEGIHGRNATDRSVQLLEKSVRNARRNFRPITPAQRVFISHNNAVGLANGPRDSLPIVWR